MFLLTYIVQESQIPCEKLYDNACFIWKVNRNQYAGLTRSVLPYMHAFFIIRFRHLTSATVVTEHAKSEMLPLPRKNGSLFQVFTLRGLLCAAQIMTVFKLSWLVAPCGSFLLNLVTTNIWYPPCFLTALLQSFQEHICVISECIPYKQVVHSSTRVSNEISSSRRVGIPSYYSVLRAST